ncbi:TPA: hypothetical protein ACKOSM_002931 [Clostridioides difficile]|uniref:hypothetical protein n=1 Tax=Clostridioides difficile TaxID=1496 RepID=UPI0018E55D59|nr:hypothetical protein [Clostridioides difficile]MCJ0172582.1 hypothetical protein [Clostridioides difficile]MDB9602585.1 hypothetical protein [Clostridioides difficile]MDM9907910.1 hypothetical protein [Clostridioides difficile]HBF3464300.1 hypothetical protein [Clostridioides difficile]HBF6440774.1 hypothetical protein [Clostridioides difficile]
MFKQRESRNSFDDRLFKKNEPTEWRTIETIISSTYALSNFKKENKDIMNQK